MRPQLTPQPRALGERLGVGGQLGLQGAHAGEEPVDLRQQRSAVPAERVVGTGSLAGLVTVLRAERARRRLAAVDADVGVSARAVVLGAAVDGLQVERRHHGAPKARARARRVHLSAG